MAKRTARLLQIPVRVDGSSAGGSTEVCGKVVLYDGLLTVDASGCRTDRFLQASFPTSQRKKRSRKRR